MRMLTFARRTAKEILRDPLTVAFGLGFPVVLLLLMSAIQANIPVDLFALERLAPGIAVFGLAFMALFASTLVAKDRESALLQRLYTTPLTAVDFILGYTLPLLPIALAQSAVCYGLAVVLGLPLSWHLLVALVGMLPMALFFIALGLLCGSVLGSKQVGGICGALLTNVTGFLSGVWFDLSLVGGWLETVAGYLPFMHAVELQKALLAGDLGGLFPHLWWVAAYAAVTLVLAVVLFLNRTKQQ